jgi:hypothetical protein
VAAVMIAGSGGQSALCARAPEWLFTASSKIPAARGTTDGETYMLIGANEQDVRGWVRLGDGAIWFSRLAVFYSRDGEGSHLP